MTDRADRFTWQSGDLEVGGHEPEPEPEPELHADELHRLLAPTDVYNHLINDHGLPPDFAVLVRGAELDEFASRVDVDDWTFGEVLDAIAHEKLHATGEPAPAADRPDDPNSRHPALREHRVEAWRAFVHRRYPGGRGVPDVYTYGRLIKEFNVEYNALDLSDEIRRSSGPNAVD
jgi:hypothetical protein